MNRVILKRLGRPIVASMAYFSGYCLLTSRFATSGRGRILSYHGISARPANPYAVATENFMRQMVYLAKRFTIISVDQLVDQLCEAGTLPPRAVAVTLDDGYRDAYTHAYPVFKQLGISATVFLPVGLIGSSAASQVAGKLAQADFLTWEQVREMSSSGLVAFGSHTMNHLSLTRLSPPELECELVRSKAELEDQTGRPVSGFAYPFGTVRDFNGETARAVGAAGYAWAVTGVSGINHRRSNRFALRRTKIEERDSMKVFVRAMEGALDPWVAVDKMGRFLRAE